MTTDDMGLEDFIEGNASAVVFKRVTIEKSNTKKVILTNVRSDWTLEMLLKELRSKDPEFSEDRNVSLTFRGKVLDDKNKKLHQYGFTESTIIRAIWRVDGGSAEDKPRAYPSDLSTWPKKIKPCQQPCFSSSYELETGKYHAEVPCCKTVTSAEAAYQMFKTEVFDRGTAEFKCSFNSSCKKPVSFGYYSWLSQLNEDEQQTFRIKHDQNTILAPNPETRQCPNEECGAYVTKPLSMPEMRVVCTQCRAYEWCWVCGEKWKSSGNLKCGNESCDPATLFQDLLVNCKTETISSIPNVPTLRLCPKCSTLLEWKKETNGCKHLKCSQCKHDFCMSCLEPWKGNEHLAVICTVKEN